MSNKKSKWIWYFGDFEFFHSQKLHLRRTERAVVFPAFWYIPEPYHNVRFMKQVKIERPEKICVTANGVGYIDILGKKYELGKYVELPTGEYTIFVHVSKLEGFPCAYIEGETVISDETWLADYYNGKRKKVGWNELYTDKNTTPEIFSFDYRKIEPVSVAVKNGGVLYDFGRETFAMLKFSRIDKDITVYYGETDIEALDITDCYTYTEVKKINYKFCEAKGFRYLYIPGISENDVEFEVFYEYLPVERKGTFKCDNEMFNRIWEVAADTFELNSREFFMDGIKRDRWVWSGDAYQSYFINRYLCFDEDIVRRTIVTLGGKGTVEQHINTINDYTFYWMMSIYDYYEMTGDKNFLTNIFPRMKEFLDFCISRLDNNGLVSWVEGDWIFIDWAEIDKTGAVCAEQMLFLRSIEIYVKCADMLGISCDEYKTRMAELRRKINKYYWNEELGAFIDSFESGKNNVTRHANIFALLFGYANETQREAIISNVILNDHIPQIKTPYFKFYELEAMCNIGKTEYVAEKLVDYWGAMINIGATSFWEEFTPDMAWQEQLGMYGLKYGKSLCHAWGASPIYLIGRYFLGVKPTSAGYKTFEICPKLEGFNQLEARIPVKNGTVEIKKQNGTLTVKADRDGGVLVYKSKEYMLSKGIEIKV